MMHFFSFRVALTVLFALASFLMVALCNNVALALFGKLLMPFTLSLPVHYISYII